jgi:indolepyruvate ferredoxin oxidoreductase
MSIRGFAHVKLANLVLARTREAELLHRFDPERHPAPATQGTPVAGQLRGIPVVSS